MMMTTNLKNNFAFLVVFQKILSLKILIVLRFSSAGGDAG